MMPRLSALTSASLAGFALLSFAIAPPLFAQSQASSGLVRGTVTSATDQPVSGATVVLRQTQTNYTRNTTTNERGIFVAALLPVGTYDVSARSPGATEARQSGVVVTLGTTVELYLKLGAVLLAAIDVTAGAPVVDPSRVSVSTTFDEALVTDLPNNGRNFLRLALLTPGVSIVQGPDGEEITVSGQRGIFNNVSVDGADFNNPFFGEQRGGQRPAFTFSQDAVQEMVVIANGANAEFGRSAGGFINVITKSGTNQLHGSAHYFGQNDAVSGSLCPTTAACTSAVGNPDFSQHQLGLTLGGPLLRDKLFFFLAYDQQIYDQTKQTDSNRIDPALRTWMDTAFGGALANDYGPISRTNNATVFMAKIDWRLSPANNFTLKYNYATSEQENGTFDVDTWARSANAIERDFSHAVNASLVSLLSSTVTNELRAQYSREERPRPYGGPTIPNSSGTLFGTNGRPFPDTGADFANGYRWGMPFFIPVADYDTRIQVLDNLSVVRGSHLLKAGFEYNRTSTTQTFIGFANERFIFGSVAGFLGYVGNGPTYVECSNTAGALIGTSNNGSCAGFPGTSISGPLQLYLQFAPVQAGQTAADAGTQTIDQTELALFLQDTWKPSRNLTLNYGLRWEAQIQPDPITPASTVFFAPLIGVTQNGYEFPSDGNIPSDKKMFQPRFGFAWDVNGDSRDVLRGSAGLYSPRTPGLDLASTRTANGSVGQNIFAASFFNGFGVTPPTYGSLAPPPTTPGTPVRPGINVTDKNFKNPRTLAISAGWEHALTRRLAGSLSYSFANTTNLNRFIDRNNAVFGTPFANFPGTTANGVGTLTVLESTAKSQYHGFTLGLNGALSRRMEFQVNYTLSYDKSDDDNERDPFSFRYAQADSLQAEYNWSDRDQRHRVNAWILSHLPWQVAFNNKISYFSSQPTSESCGTNNLGTGTPASTPQSRICPDGHILLRNTIRKGNEYFQWDARLARPFTIHGGQTLEVLIEVFNVLNTRNVISPSAPALLFNFDGTIRSGIGDPRRVQAGLRYSF
jgi:hypothetical protein